MWRVMPETTSIYRGGVFRVNVPVTRWIIHPAGAHNDSPIKNDWVAVEIVTPHGSGWQGFRDAAIGPDLRIHCDTTDRERDEVIAKWAASDFYPIK